MFRFMKTGFPVSLVQGTHCASFVPHGVLLPTVQANTTPRKSRDVGSTGRREGEYHTQRARFGEALSVSGCSHFLFPALIFPVFSHRRLFSAPLSLHYTASRTDNPTISPLSLPNTCYYLHVCHGSLCVPVCFILEI